MYIKFLGLFYIINFTQTKSQFFANVKQKIQIFINISNIVNKVINLNVLTR